MTGREKIEAAFSVGGTTQVPAVICYEGIFVRDHWEQLTSVPWWYRESPVLEHQLAWRREAIEKTGQDWFNLPGFYSRQERQALVVEVRGGDVFRVDGNAGSEELLVRPEVGGWSPAGGLHSVSPECLATTAEAIDALVPMPPETDVPFLEEGRGDLAAALLAEYGSSHYPICHVSSPLWACYGLWGFEGMMGMIATRPDLVEHAGRRFLQASQGAVRQAALLGASGIWIEECLTDLVSPASYAALVLPLLNPLVEEIRRQGLKSIYYYCGDPAGRWDLLLAVGADVLALEESKKGFVIDVDEVVTRARGRCAVLGNLDAMSLLERGSEAELRGEIARQIAAGQRIDGRFAMGLGSPVTPGTPVERVRRYCDLVHELGGA